jgi:hypothetical protein
MLEPLFVTLLPVVFLAGLIQWPWRFGASASSEATTIAYITSTLMSG